VISHSFDTGDYHLAVHDWGGNGAPVLLAHPTGFHGVVWKPVAERLVAAGRHVWSFDFRGHGDSDAPDVREGAYAWEWFAADVAAVAEHLGVARNPHLVACGHSKGGTALLLAEAHAPGTFPRIWAYEPIMFPADLPLPPNADFPLARSARKRRAIWESREAAYASYSSRPPLNVMTADALHAYVDYGLRDRADGTVELKCRPEVEAQIYTMGPNNGAWQHLPEIDALVTVVCGETSTDIGPPLAARIADRLPNGSLEVLPGCGHFGPQQDPQACARSILP
jgi:pimeloyl-ACP methyl ester carboxylesterase